MNGHEVTFDGTLTMAFRMNDQNELIAFEGQNCTEVEIDGELFVFSEDPLEKIAFAPSQEKAQEIRILVRGESTVSIPLSSEIASRKLKLTASNGKKVNFKQKEAVLLVDVDSQLNGKWLSLAWN